MGSNVNDIKENLKRDAGRSSLYNNEVFQSVIKTFGTGIGVASVLYPLEVIRTRLHTGTPIKFIPATPFLFNYKTLQPLISGFFSANKASVVKNSVISNREMVAGHVDTIVGEKGAEQNAFLKKYKGVLVTTGIIAGLDTGLTQYYSNIRVLYSLGHDPAFTLQQKFIFATKGMLVRGLRNYATTLACISTTTVLSDFMQPWLSSEQHPLAHAAATNITSGFVVAPFTTALDVTYKRMLMTMDFSTLKTSSYKQVIFGVWKAEGITPFFRGTLLGGVYTTLAFATINGISYLMDTQVFPKAQVQAQAQDQVQAPKGPSAFFAVPAAPLPVDSTEANEVSETPTPPPNNSM